MTKLILAGGQILIGFCTLLICLFDFSSDAAVAELSANAIVHLNKVRIGEAKIEILLWENLTFHDPISTSEREKEININLTAMENEWTLYYSAILTTSSSSELAEQINFKLTKFFEVVRELHWRLKNEDYDSVIWKYQESVSLDDELTALIDRAMAFHITGSSH